jgi:cytochrome c oxidase subunit II
MRRQSDNIGSTLMRRMAAGLAAAGAAVAGSAAWAVGDMPGGPAVNQLNLPIGVTHIAADQYWIHNLLLLVCLAIFVAVFGVMFYSIWKHRKSKGHKPADFHEITSVEIAWTVVPFLIIIGLAIPATRMVIEQKDTSQAELTIKITGYQWLWGYEYMSGEAEGLSFLSRLSTPRAQIANLEPKSPTYLMEVDNPMVVPVGQKVRLVITAADVIHSWAVPQFGVKQDAIPGFVRDTWFRAERTGVYRGSCVELCGKDHAFMPIVVEVKSQDEYQQWAQAKRKEMLALADDPTKEWSVADLTARGERVYAANCVACHQATGQGVAGAFPALTGSKVVLGPQDPLISILLDGVPGTAMASFRQLSDVELAAVATYTRNAWNNQAEDPVVQPADVAAARK